MSMSQKLDSYGDRKIAVTDSGPYVGRSHNKPLCDGTHRQPCHAPQRNAKRDNTEVL